MRPHRFAELRQGLALSVALVVVAAVLFVFITGAQAVPLHPDVVQKLREEGRLASVIEQMDQARVRGVNHPHGSAAGWLRAGDGTTTTERQTLVIIVDFDDNAADTGTYPQEHYWDLLFSEDTYPTGSMRDYYVENSYGEFGVIGVVTVWYRMPELYSYYVDGQAGFGYYPHNAQKLAEDAVAAADPDVDFSLFDNDGPDGIPNSGDDDGIVDALFIVHAGPGRETTGSDDDIHSHAWSMPPQSVDGVTASGYSMEPEDGKRGVFGHEFGHVLGLPDLYDTDYSSNGIGYWGMMAAGSWGNGGVTPVHFCAWSKMKLGFLDPIRPEENLNNVEFPRVEDNAVAYILWTSGLPDKEYFIVENRQQALGDAHVPGSGLVIYHIDENVSGNSNDWHPLVMVEQADGLFDLQAGNGTDDGDPYPGSSGNYEFSAATNPSSNDYNGEPTQVSVNVNTPSQDTMEADLIVETQPNLLLTFWEIDDTIGGNGDMRLDPGESITIPTEILNVGTDILGVNGTLSEPGGQGITIDLSSSAYGNLPPDSSAAGVPSYGLTLDSGATIEAVTLNLDLSGSERYNQEIDFLVGVSDSLGFFNWNHGIVSANYQDQWHISTQRNHTPGGQYCWKFGGSGSGNYNDYSDGALETQMIYVNSNTILRFWHWIDAEDQGATEAWDGGVLEMSVEGGSWMAITPAGGYTHTIISNPASPFAPGRPCFSGHSSEWTQVEVSLSTLGSWVQLRWRFGSDGAVTDGGWFIDDVSVEGATSGVPDFAAATRLWLSRPAPNPATGSAAFTFSIPSAGSVYQLDLYDLSGRLVRNLAQGVTPANGAGQSVLWDGLTSEGKPASAGFTLRASRLKGPGCGPGN